MTSHTLNYVITRQTGPSYYSEETDEDFYDTTDYDWDYEVYEDDIADAWIEIYGKKGNSLEDNCKLVVEELISLAGETLEGYLKEAEVSSLDEAVEQARESIRKFNASEYAKEHGKHKEINAYNLLDELLGDIGYYFDYDEENMLDYFREDAEADFNEIYGY